MKNLRNYEFLVECKNINDNYKNSDEFKENGSQPLFTPNFEKFLDESIEEVKNAGAEKNPKVANAIINNHLKGINN